MEEEEDEEFIRFIKEYREHSRPHVLERLARYPDKEVHIFTDRAGAASFLARLQEEYPGSGDETKE